MVVDHDTLPSKQVSHRSSQSAACALQPAARVKLFSTIQVTGLFRHAVPSPSFPTWELSVTEYNCQSVFFWGGGFCQFCLSLDVSAVCGRMGHGC